MAGRRYVTLAILKGGLAFVRSGWRDPELRRISVSEIPGNWFLRTDTFQATPELGGSLRGDLTGWQRSPLPDHGLIFRTTN